MEYKTIRKIFLFIVGLILWFLIKQFASKHMTNLANDDFKVFNQTNINGILIKTDILHHTISFKVNNNSTEFSFYPRIGIGKSRDFSSFVEVGDSIIKPAFSETLILRRGYKTYTYAFEHK
ncbi:MAG: hypothetical protein ABIU77_10310 [Ferruginibacter sp.]